MRQAEADPVIAAVGFAEAMVGLGDLARAQGESERALALFRQALQRLLEVAPAEWEKAGQDGLWVKYITAECLRLTACTAGLTADPVRAARVLGAGDALRTASSQGLLRVERARHDRDAAPLRGRMAERDFSAAREAGQSLAIVDAVADALLLIVEATAMD